MQASRGAGDVDGVDQSRRTYIDYIDRTRAHYLAEGFNNPYAWAHFQYVPFTPLAKPLAECRIGLVTTAAPYQPTKGDQGPHAPYNNDAKFRESYHAPISPTPDLRISHIAYDRANTVPDDLNAYFPRQQLLDAVTSGRIGSIPERFYAAPTARSQRRTVEKDGPAILQWARDDGIDAALLPTV